MRLRRAIASAVLAATGCATAGPPVTSSWLASDVAVGTVAEPSSFERSDPAPAKADRPPREGAEDRRAKAFWAGVGLATGGALGATAFGIGGRVVQAQLANGYADGELSHADEDRLQTTGEVMNGLTIGTALVGIAGVALLSVTYALDWQRCGKLPPARKDCPSRRGAR